MVRTSQYSKGQVDRAGKVLCRALVGVAPLPSWDEITHATSVVEAYRRAHSIPMLSARMGLQSCIYSEAVGPVELTQRLKRMPTVIDKLRRLETMKLSNMQDIGGCRAVFSSQEEITRVQDRFTSNSRRRNEREDKVRDYVANPRDSGYRAVHIWTRYRGHRVEVQLRTELQHRWAELVEDISVLTSIDYKSGDGHRDVHRWLHSLSEAYEMIENDEPIPSEFQRDYAEIRVAAQSRISRERHLRRRRHG